MTKTQYFFGLTVFLLVFSSCLPESKKNITKLNGVVFGTSYHITYLNAIDYTISLDSLFSLVNKSLSTYIPTSDISKINRGDTTVVLDAYFLEVMRKSKRIYEETDGYFDPTVGSLVNAWGFGPENKRKDLDSIKVRKLMESVGFHKVQVQKNSIKKQISEIYLDFNSIAKGYGIDIVGRFLESKGIQNYLVEIGGEIRARGQKNNGKLWKIAIDDPNNDGTRSVSRFVELKNESLASSGNYRKYRIGKNGKKYVHTVNPKTGYATESNLLSATVYGAVDCADVDAYATAFMAMGLEKTKGFLNGHPELKVILLYFDEKGAFKEFKN